MQEKDEALEKQLEELLTEGDEIGERLGPDIRKRMIDIEINAYESIERRCNNWSCALGGLGTLAIAILGYNSGILERVFEKYNAFGGIIVSTSICVMAYQASALPLMTIGCLWKNRRVNREFHILQRRFPEKAKDIKRDLDLRKTYDSLLPMSGFPGL